MATDYWLLATDSSRQRCTYPAITTPKAGRPGDEFEFKKRTWTGTGVG